MLAKGLKTRVAVSVLVLVIGAVAYGLGQALWQGIAIATVASVLLIGDQAFHHWRGRREQRVRVDRSQEEGRRCKGCDGDLWGLEVQPSKSGRVRVKCLECGTVNEYRPGKPRRRRKRPSRTHQREEEDTRSFKIR